MTDTSRKPCLWPSAFKYDAGFITLAYGDSWDSQSHANRRRIETNGGAENSLRLATTETLQCRLFETGRSNIKEMDQERMLLVHDKVYLSNELNGGTEQKYCEQAISLAMRAAEEKKRTASELRLDIIVRTTPNADSSNGMLYYRGPMDRDAMLFDWFCNLSQPGEKSLILKRCWGKAADIVEMLFVAKCDAGRERLDIHTNELLDILMIGNRPVARWRAHFFAPVKGDLSTDADDWLFQEFETNVKNYFLPHLRDSLGFDGNIGPGLKSFCHKTNSKLEVQISNPLYDKPLIGRISNIHLHNFSGGDEATQLLEWQLEGGDALELDDSDPQKDSMLWQRYLMSGNHPRWSIAQFIDFMAEARFITHAYQHEVLVLNKVEESFAELCKPLEAPFRLKLDEGNFSQFILDAIGSRSITPRTGGDDRAKVICSAILEGGATSKGELDRALAVLNTLDPYDTGGFYDGAFARQEYEASQYRRFWDRGSHFLATEHSFAFVGFRQSDDLSLVNPRAGFSERLIHEQHTKYIYHRMFLLVLFQQLALEDVGREIAQPFNGSDAVQKIIKLREKWINLRNSRWFTSVSTQVQGAELYRHLQSRVRIDRDVVQLGEKLADLESVLVLEDERKNIEEEQRSAVIRGSIEVLGLPTAIFLALRGMMERGDGLNETSILPIFKWFWEAIGVVNPSAFTFGLACLTALIIASVRALAENKTGRQRWLPTGVLALFLCFSVCVSWTVEANQQKIDMPAEMTSPFPSIGGQSTSMPWIRIREPRRGRH